MILAEKIIKLRKQLGWSQEELAEKMDVSRQSVSKWESTTSIPDLNKIIMLAEIFEVSTDFLLKDENEVVDDNRIDNSSDVFQINLEHANKYVETKMAISTLINKGVMLCVCSVVPMFFFLAMANANKLNMSGDIAAALGVICILVMVSVGVSFFIKINQYENDVTVIDNEPFELAYGVHSVFQEKLQKFRPTYNRQLSIAIFLFITSFVPVMMVSMFNGTQGMVLLMLVVLILMIATGIFMLIPVSARFEAYNNILKDNDVNSQKSKRAKRAEKLAAFYWPLLTAIFLGWSLWTMNWGVTWIIWPVGAVLFAALLGLMELLEKD